MQSIKNGMRGSWTTLQDSQFSFPTLAPSPPEWPSEEDPGSCSTAAGVGRFLSCLHKQGMASSAACEYSAEEQSVDHVVLQCPIHRPPHGLLGLMVLGDEAIERLLNTC